MINEEIINKPYRAIAQCATVSIDTVGKALKELLEEQFLIKFDRKTLKVQNRERLLQEWVIIFNRVLRPNLKQRTFKPRNSSIAALLHNAEPNSIGGALAAESLTNHLIPERGLIYTDQSFVEVAKKLELLPDVNGPITLIEKFWKDRLCESPKVTVNPILIYADLLNNPKPRNLEAAKIIYDKYVKTIL